MIPVHPSFRIVPSFILLLGLILATSVLAAPGPGVVQPTWLASEIGKEIYTFDKTIIGYQPTMNAFEHGYLIIEAAHSVSPDPTVSGKISWYDLSNPRSPVLLSQKTAGGNKPHMIAFWGSKMIDGFQNNKNFNIWDVENKTLLSTYIGSVNPVWYMGQIPYVFRPRNGYATDANLMEIVDVTTGTGTQIGLIDLGSFIPFAVGSLHAIGNLLVCSASQAAGVATFDISDPANPKLLGSLVTGQPVYTSMVYGSRVYQCETANGIRVYDFSDPTNIKVVGFIPFSGSNPRYVMLKNGKGYCTPGAAKITVFDATTLAVLNNWPLGGGADFVQLLGNMAITGGSGTTDNRCSIVPIQQVPDTNGPVVTYVNPPDGARNQGLKSRVGFVMDDQIDVLSLTTNSFIVRPVGGSALNGTYSTQLGMINFTPAQPLQNNTDYEIILPIGGIRDAAGNAITQPFNSHFSTGGSVATNTTVTNMVLRWPFEQNGEDTTGNQHLATLIGNAGYSTNSALGSYSLSLSGSSAYASAASVTLSNQFTLSLWARIATNGADIETLLANSASGSGTSGFRFFINTYLTSDRTIRLETGNGSAGAVLATGTGVFATNQWNHLAVVIDRTAGTGKIFYGGTQVATTGTVRTDFANANPLTVAAMSGGNFQFKGNIDDVRIFNRALTSDEIAALAAKQNTPPTIQSFIASTNTPLVGQSVTFTTAAADVDADKLNFTFNFGDGSAPTNGVSTVSHSFAAPGRYSVVLQVDDGITTVSSRLLINVHYSIPTSTPKISSQIIYDSSTDKIWCVNPDSDSVSRINALTLAKEMEIAVGKKPRSFALRPGANQIFVACERSASLSVLNATSGVLITNTDLGYGFGPDALVISPDGLSVFVAGRAGSITKLSCDTLTPIAICGPGNAGVSSLALSGDGTRLLATRFISPDTQGEVWDINASNMSLTRTLPLAFDNTVDGENTGRGVPNYLIAAAITPDGRRAWVPSKKDNIARGLFRDGQMLTHDNTVRSIISQIDLVTNAEDLTARLDVDNHSIPGSMCFSPLGDLAYIVYQGNNELRVFDTATRNSLSSIDTPDAPQSICINPSGSRVYVLNFLARSISAYDIAAVAAGTSSVITPIATNIVATEKLSPQVLAGKRIFYSAADPRMADEGYLTCISCHLDGGHDGRTWDFTDRGEGLRNTTTLEGRRGMGQGLVHWSANFDEIQDFEGDIRNAFGGTGFMSDTDFNFQTRNTSLGTPKTGISPELDALAAYVSSLTNYPPSPNRNFDGTPLIGNENGRQHFIDLNCYTCHTGADFTDSSQYLLHDVGTIKPSSGNRLHHLLAGIDTPTLRGLWQTAPYLHDGSATNLLAVFDAAHAPDGTPHAAFRSLTFGEQGELLGFLNQLDDSDEPMPQIDAPPALRATTQPNQLLLSWPPSPLTLFSTPDLNSSALWNPVTTGIQTNNGMMQLSLPLSADKNFFQLRLR